MSSSYIETLNTEEKTKLEQMKILEKGWINPNILHTDKITKRVS